MRHRMIRLSSPVSLRLTVGNLRHGPLDPTIRIERGCVWRATRTADGPATLRFVHDGCGVEVSAWGDGAQLALELAPGMLGIDDDPSVFKAQHPVVRDMQRRLSGLRLGRSGAVVESLVPSIIEQKVTSAEAHRSYRDIVLRFGERAPGPAALWLQPAPDRLASLPYYALHPFGIERRRADTIKRVCARAARMEEAASMPFADARLRLRAIQGVGEWTAAEVARDALGDPDVVSVGDYHLKHIVAWVLAGEPRATDERMLELLEPYRGQRTRAIRLIEASGITPPRYGPRVKLRSIAAM